MFVLDAHLDLAMNAMEWNRDLCQPLSVLREREMNLTDKSDRGNGMVCFEEMRKGNIGLVVASLIAKCAIPPHHKGWQSQAQAWAQTQGQLAWYKSMEAMGELRPIITQKDLKNHLALWMNPMDEKKPIGYVLSLEGADSLIDLDHLHLAYQAGLRVLGPAHYGPGIYADGTNANAPFPPAGLALLKEMQQLNLLLDCTHLCDQAFWQAMDIYEGPIWASHQLCRSLVNHNRQFSDEMIKALAAKKGVMGLAMDAWMMVPNWEKGKSSPQSQPCSLSNLLDHVDHVCQLTGNSLHIGIGSDLDGGYGKEQCPVEMNSIADIQKIPALLANRGYQPSDIDNIMHGNFLSRLEQVLV